jgi:hypothetical protein
MALLCSDFKIAVFQLSLFFFIFFTITSIFLLSVVVARI